MSIPLLDFYIIKKMAAPNLFSPSTPLNTLFTVLTLNLHMPDVNVQNGVFEVFGGLQNLTILEHMYVAVLHVRNGKADTEMFKFRLALTKRAKVSVT